MNCYASWMPTRAIIKLPCTLSMRKAPLSSLIGVYIATKWCSFWLKNVEATYQMLINKMIANLIGKTMEVYTDEILVKSLKSNDHVTHLNETFESYEGTGWGWTPSNVRLVRKIFGSHGQQNKDRGKSQKDSSLDGNKVHLETKGSAKPSRSHGRLKSFHFKGHQQMSPFLQSFEEVKIFNGQGNVKWPSRG